MPTALSIALGAAIGALVRWKLGEALDPLLPNLPMGTLSANLLGSFLMGIALFLLGEQALLSSSLSLGITTGFLGSLTTFSTFSTEALSLFLQEEFFALVVFVSLHVVGSIAMVATGYVSCKWLFLVLL